MYIPIHMEEMEVLLQLKELPKTYSLYMQEKNIGKSLCSCSTNQMETQL